MSHGERLPDFEMGMRTVREELTDWARVRICSARTMRWGSASVESVRACSARSSSRMSPRSGSKRGVEAFCVTETLTGTDHPKRSGSSLCALKVDEMENAVRSANSRSPRPLPRSPKPSSVKLKRAFRLARSASARLAVRKPAAPCCSS